MRKSGLVPPTGLNIVARHEDVRPDADNRNAVVVHRRTHQRARSLRQVRQPCSGPDREVLVKKKTDGELGRGDGGEKGQRSTWAPRGLWWDVEPWCSGHTGKCPFCHSGSPLSGTPADPRPSGLVLSALSSERPLEWLELPRSPSTAAGGTRHASVENTTLINVHIWSNLLGSSTGSNDQTNKIFTWSHSKICETT